MLAMVCDAPGRPLRRDERPEPAPGLGQVLVKVAACGVCRTDLHVADGELTQTRYPIVPGHEVVGRIAAVGPGVAGLALGDRVGIPWLGWTCGACRFCRAGQENLCDNARFTGCTIDGGYAQGVVADARYCFRLPASYGDREAAPLLCAGLIGHRAHRMVADAERIGLYGFGAAAHILAQVAVHRGQQVYAFTRPGDQRAQNFARSLGATWAGGSDQLPPDQLDAAIIFAPVGALVPAALAAVRKGGTVVAAGIHMTDLPTFPYERLWGERVVRSVANLTRADGDAFFAIAAATPIVTTVTPFALTEANAALAAVRDGRLIGAAVLIP
jgi:propanol-preferring alcohol dehydrogenase